MKYLSTDQAEQLKQLIIHCGHQAEQMATAEQFQVFEKGENDPVTSVDRALDAQLLAGVSALFPQDGIITEENAPSKRVFYRNLDRIWLIDPIDGTSSFIKRQPHYAVMVGLLKARQPTAGWIYAPAQAQLYWGGQDWGLFQAQDGHPTEALVPHPPKPPSTNFCPIMLGYWDQQRYGHAIAHQLPAAQFYSIGSFGLKVIEVIRGNVGLYLYCNGRVKLWDTTAPLALAQSAGLICCDLDGNPIRFQPDAIDRQTMAHRRPIVVGWPQYIELLLPKVQQAVMSVIS